MKRRNWLYNDHVRRIAGVYDAVLVDYWCFEEYSDPGLWDADRLLRPTGPPASGSLRPAGVMALS